MFRDTRQRNAHLAQLQKDTVSALNTVIHRAQNEPRQCGVEILLDEPGLFNLLILDLLDSFASFNSGGVPGDEDRGDDGSSHARGGADMLLLRMPLNDFLCDSGGGSGWGCTMCSGTGSRSSSGRESSAFGSSICILSCMPSGMPSRINSGSESMASGSFVLFLPSTAS